MKWKITIMILMAIVIAMATVATAYDFDPGRDINLRDIYDIKNAVDIETACLNLSGDYRCSWIEIGEIPAHNALSGLQGGTTDQYYHLNQSVHDTVISKVFSWITAAFFDQDLNTTDSVTFVNITANNITADYYYGQPIDGGIGSGIINSSSNKAACACINASDMGGLNVWYPDLLARIWNFGEMTYCNIPSATVTVSDDGHQVYYVDSSCSVLNRTWGSYFAQDLNPANYARIFDAYAKNGDIEIVKGSTLMAMVDRKTKWVNVNCGEGGHLSICDGINVLENTFPDFNQTAGHYNYVHTVHTSAFKQASVDGIHIVTASDGIHTIGTGINLSACDDGSGLITCSSSKYRRYIIYTIGFGVENTKIHQLAPLDGVTYSNIGDCINLEKYPLTYTLPDEEDGVAVIHHLYCGRRDDSSWSGSWIDLRGDIIYSGPGIDTSIFLTIDGARQLTDNWDAGPFNITADYFFGDGSQLTGITETDPYWTGNYSGLTSGQVLFGQLEQDGNLTWDDTNKRFGIGTDSPAAKLDLSHDAASGDVLNIASSADEYFKITQEGYVSIKSLNHAGVYIRAGNVSSYPVFGLIDEGSGSAIQWNIAHGQRGDGILSFELGGARMVINGTSGNVGVGTITPQNKLNVVGDINFTGLIYGNGSQLTGITITETDPLWTDNSSTVARTGNCPAGQVVMNTTTSGVQCVAAVGEEVDPLYTGNVSNIAFTNIDETFDEKLTVTKDFVADPSGNVLYVNSTSHKVGVGTSNPFVKFTVEDGNILIDRTDASNAILRLRNVNDEAQIYLHSTEGDIRFYNDADLMTIQPDGDVGIGTTSPQNKLNVIGDLNVTSKSYMADIDFNDGWTSGGLSIINGDIYAQTGYFYNITGLDVQTLNVNGSIIPQAGFDNQFDLGSSTLRWNDLFLGGKIYADELYLGGKIYAGDWTNVSITESQISDLQEYYLKSNPFDFYNSTTDGSGSGLDADLLDAQHGSYYRDASNLNAGTVPAARLSQTQSFYATDPRLPVTNQVHSTLSSPTIAELSIPNSPYVGNKLQFVVPTISEYTTDGENWNATTYTATELKQLVQGRYDGSSVYIPSPNQGEWVALRMTFTTPGYRFLNWLYLYTSTRGHQMNVKIEKSNTTDPDAWFDVAQTSNWSSWPGHQSIPHSSIPWHPTGGTPGSHAKYVRITFYPAYSGSYPANGITIYNINWYGYYPANRADDTWYWDYDNNMYIKGDLDLADNDLENIGTVYHDFATTRYFNRLSSDGTEGGTLYDTGSFWNTTDNYLRYRGYSGVALDVQTTNVLTSTAAAMTIVPDLTLTGDLTVGAIDTTYQGDGISTYTDFLVVEDTDASVGWAKFTPISNGMALIIADDFPSILLQDRSIPYNPVSITYEGIPAGQMLSILGAEAVSIGEPTPWEAFNVEGNAYFTGSVNASSFNGAGTGLTGTAASLTCGAGDSATGFFSSGSIPTTYTDAKCTSAACNDAVYSEATIQSVCTDCIGDAQLLYNTGQHLTTTTKPQFAGVNLGGATYYLGSGAAASKLYTLSINEIYADVGAIGDPSYTWTGDTNTGLYWIGADQLGVTLGGVMRAAFKPNYFEVKPSTDSYGIIVRDSGSTSYANLQNINGVTYLKDQTSAGLAISGTAVYVPDHGTGTTDMLSNVVYSDSACPTASTTTIGTICVVY